MTRFDHASVGKSLDSTIKPCQTLTQNPFWTQCLYFNLVKRTRAKLARDSLMLPRLRHLSPNTVLPAAWTTTTLSRTSTSRPHRLCPTILLFLPLSLLSYYSPISTPTLAVFLLFSYSYSHCLPKRTTLSLSFSLSLSLPLFLSLFLSINLPVSLSIYLSISF